MKPQSYLKWPWAFLLVLVMPTVLGATGGLAIETRKADGIQVTGLRGLPLSFEPNQGQADPRVKFLSRGKGYQVLLTADEVVLSLERGGRQDLDRASRPSTSRKPSVVRMRLLDSSSSPRMEGLDRLPGKSNYLRGSDPGEWHTGIPNYSRVRYQEVFPGIDLVLYGNQSHLEY